MMGINLLSCPFCGGPGEIHPDDLGSGGQHVSPYHAGCSKCRIYFTEEVSIDAIDAWNSRAALRAAPGAEPKLSPSCAAAGKCPPFTVCDYCQGVGGTDTPAGQGAMPACEVTGVDLTGLRATVRIVEGAQPLQAGTKIYLAPAHGERELDSFGRDLREQNLAMMLRRMAARLKSLDHGAALGGQAFELLERMGLKGSPLRAPDLAPAHGERQSEKWMDEWKRECNDADQILLMLDLNPNSYRSGGGSLMLSLIATAISADATHDKRERSINEGLERAANLAREEAKRLHEEAKKWPPGITHGSLSDREGELLKFAETLATPAKQPEGGEANLMRIIQALYDGPKEGSAVYEFARHDAGRLLRAALRAAAVKEGK